MRGDCASCGFPISVKNTVDKVACPFCSTVNTPVSGGISISPGWVLLAAVVGVLVLSKARR
jgi:hypothetical protein